MFVSVDGKAKKIKEIFAGGKDGIAHRITEAFGSVNNTAKRVFTSSEETNAFNTFSWAEIKQLANEGKLLEHFNKHDKVTIKLTKPIVYTNTNGTDIQNEITMQIAELTESKMRLTSYQALVTAGGFNLYYKESDISGHESLQGWRDFVDDFQSGAISLSSVGEYWGLTDAYKLGFSQLEEALPEDLKAVLTIFTPVVEYKKNSFGYLTKTYEEVHVRQISGYTHKYSIDAVNEIIKVTETDFPMSESRYKYYFKGNSVEEGASWKPNGGFVYNIIGKKSYGEKLIFYKYANAPNAVWNWDEKDVTMKNRLRDSENTIGLTDVIPEFIIEADA